MRLPWSLARTLVLGALLVTVAVHVRADVTLRLNPELGAVYEVFTSVDTTTEQTMMGIESKSTQESHTLLEIVFEQGEAPDEFSVAAIITAASLDATEDGEPALAGAEDGPGAIIAAAAEAIVGHAFAMTVSTAGQVTGVSGMDEVMDTLFDVLDVPEEAKPMLTDALKQQFGDAPMQQTMSQAFVTFPPGPVAIGASWRVEMSTMGLRAVSEMTLESVEGGVATIVETTTMEPDPDHEPEVGALSFTYDQVDGSAGATYRVDVETGMLLDADLEQEMAATINVSMPGMPEGFASQMPPIPMVMSAVAHVELVKLD